MTRDEWVKRCARQLRRRDSSLQWRFALMWAGGIAKDQADLYGESGIAWESPEDAADRKIWPTNMSLMKMNR